MSSFISRHLRKVNFFLSICPRKFHWKDFTNVNNIFPCISRLYFASLLFKMKMWMRASLSLSLTLVITKRNNIRYNFAVRFSMFQYGQYGTAAIDARSIFPYLQHRRLEVTEIITVSVPDRKRMRTRARDEFSSRSCFRDRKGRTRSDRDVSLWVTYVHSHTYTWNYVIVFLSKD